MYLTTLRSGDKFEREFHKTYIVFRDKSRNEDHLVSICAVGDVSVAQGRAEIYASVGHSTGNIRVFEVAPHEEEIAVEVIPRTIELASLSSAPTTPKIVLTSDAMVRIRYPSWFALDTTFGLNEVKSVRLDKGFLYGATIVFALANKDYLVSYTADDSAPLHFSTLRSIAGPMAPHVQFVTTWNWFPLLIIVPLGLFIVACLIRGISTHIHQKVTSVNATS
jgi:hypothetical protein